MTSKEQSICFLLQYLKTCHCAPWIAEYASQQAIDRLQGLGGMAGTWRTDYSECTYYYPVMVEGSVQNFSTVEKLRAFYEARPINTSVSIFDQCSNKTNDPKKDAVCE